MTVPESWSHLAGRPVLALAILALGWLAPSAASGQTSKEEDLKAVLLYNFTQFVDWPPSSFSSPEAPLVIGILGRDPFGRMLDDLVQRETRDHRRIVVERYRTIDVVKNCQILFVDAGEKHHFAQILLQLRGRPVLTVGDFDDFARAGGMIRFLRNPENKISLRINLDAAKAAGLNISARLLRVAEVIPQRDLTP